MRLSVEFWRVESDRVLVSEIVYRIGKCFLERSPLGPGVSHVSASLGTQRPQVAPLVELPDRGHVHLDGFSVHPQAGQPLSDLAPKARKEHQPKASIVV
jgi:hypothetical protein